MKYLMIFNSTSHAIRAESVFLIEDIEVRVKSIPNEISAGCGISVCFDDLISVKNAIEKNNIQYSSIFIVENNTFNLINNV